jgi:hypothetical protein
MPRTNGQHVEFRRPLGAPKRPIHRSESTPMSGFRPPRVTLRGRSRWPNSTGALLPDVSGLIVSPAPACWGGRALRAALSASGAAHARTLGGNRWARLPSPGGVVLARTTSSVQASTIVRQGPRRYARRRAEPWGSVGPPSGPCQAVVPSQAVRPLRNQRTDIWLGRPVPNVGPRVRGPRHGIGGDRRPSRSRPRLGGVWPRT